MSHYEAMILLDKVKDGNHFPLYLINQALELTGDLQGMYQWYIAEKTYPMQETELFWSKPRQGKYTKLGKQTEITILCVPGLSVAKGSTELEQEIESGPICQE